MLPCRLRAAGWVAWAALQAGAVDAACFQNEASDKLLASHDAATSENSWSHDEEKAGSAGEDEEAEVGDAVLSWGRAASRGCCLMASYHTVCPL